MQQNSLITAFSEISDSILMWSYYAKDHKGFCIEYSLNELMKSQRILPVVYSDKMLQITEYTDNNRIIGMLVKAKCWEHEREWRIIKLADNNTSEKGELIENIPSPTAFFYGSRIWDNERDNFDSGLSGEDAAISIQQIMEYTKGKMPLYGYDLSRKEFELKKIILKH